MSIFSRLETFAYKHVFIPRQGKHTFDFIGDLYSKGEKVIDFGSGIGTNSRLFSPDDYIGLEINKSRVSESCRAFPNYNFQKLHLSFPCHSASRLNQLMLKHEIHYY